VNDTDFDANLFSGGGPPRPLADRMRPDRLARYAGQRHLLAEGKPLRALIDKGGIPSLIFWGPPGSGKTTLARIVARETGSTFIEVSAVAAGVKELREAVDRAKRQWTAHRRRTVLFIDEVHRFSKVQQDAILPHVESGLLTIIGSTTENPAFEVIPALRSRCRIFRLYGLSFDEVVGVLTAALADDERGMGGRVPVADGVLERIAELSGGDARAALNLLEAGGAAAGDGAVTTELVEELSRDSAILYDKQGQEHYDHASAFQKSLRGSDPDAAVYWLAKMLAGGEDPRFVARRLIVTASEDVGLADPTALLVAMAAAEAVDRLGMPECRIPLAHATLHVATAPKSDSAIGAIDKAMSAIAKEGRSFPVPSNLKDAHYKDAKGYGFGVGYRSPHNYPGHWVAQNYLPDELAGARFYEPGDMGRERAVKEWLDKRRGEEPEPQ
jgi:putative ATPase